MYIFFISLYVSLFLLYKHTYLTNIDVLLNVSRSFFEVVVPIVIPQILLESFHCFTSLPTTGIPDLLSGIVRFINSY